MWHKLMGTPRFWAQPRTDRAASRCKPPPGAPPQARPAHVRDVTCDRPSPASGPDGPRPPGGRGVFSRAYVRKFVDGLCTRKAREDEETPTNTAGKAMPFVRSLLLLSER